MIVPDAVIAVSSRQWGTQKFAMNPGSGREEFTQPEQVRFTMTAWSLSHHMPQSPYFVSTNQEVQTHPGVPHQPPILRANPSSCRWNAAAGGGKWTQKANFKWTRATFWQDPTRSSECESVDGEITSFTSLAGDQGCNTAVLFSCRFCSRVHSGVSGGGRRCH